MALVTHFLSVDLSGLLLVDFLLSVSFEHVITLLLLLQSGQVALSALLQRLLVLHTV